MPGIPVRSCPFCGSSVKTYESVDKSSTWFTCEGPDSQCGAHVVFAHGGDKDIEAFNRRFTENSNEPFLEQAPAYEPEPRS